MSELEAATIEAARAYATANGYAGDDRTAAGLVLAGMVIGAILSSDAQAELVSGYLHQHRGAAGAMQRWAEWIEAAGLR